MLTNAADEITKLNLIIINTGKMVHLKDRKPVWSYYDY
jgi:hypothetical protein